MDSYTPAPVDNSPTYVYTSPAPQPDPELITQDAAMRRLLGQIDRVADSPATVLITGESGTGKEILAQILHRRSKRRNAPCVRLRLATRWGAGERTLRA